MHEVVRVWTPGPGNQKPPRSFAAAPSSEKEITAVKNPQSEPIRFPVPPPRNQPHYVPCPSEVKEQMKALFEKLTMDKNARDTKRNDRLLRNPNLTHMQRLELSTPADEVWFKRNQHRVDQILREREIKQERGEW